MKTVLVNLREQQLADLAEISAARGNSFDEVVRIAVDVAITHSQDYFGVTLPAVFRTGRRDTEQVPA